MLNWRKWTIVSNCCSKSASHLLRSFVGQYFFILYLPVFVVDHFDYFRLIAIREQIMRRINILKAFFIISSSLIIDSLVFFFYFNGKNLHSVNKFFCIGSIILWEIHINKTSQGMSISSDSYITILISMPINNLLL